MSILQDHAGFNVTNSKLQVVELNFENDDLILENVDEESFSSQLTANFNDSNTSDIFRNTINSISSRKPLYSKKVSFTLPDSFFYVASIPYESDLTEEDLNDHINWELSVLYPHISVDDLAVQKIKMPITQFSFTPSLLVYAIKKDTLKFFHQYCVDNNLELNFIDNAHIASNNFIVKSSESDELILSAYIYETHISIILLQSGIPVFRSSAPLTNSDLFTSVFSSELDKLNELGLIQSQISKFYISGQNIADFDINEIQTSLDIEFQQIDPFKNLKTAPSISSGKFVNQFKSSFTAAAGIALRLV